jgi:hypothetical protein
MCNKIDFSVISVSPSEEETQHSFAELGDADLKHNHDKLPLWATEGWISCLG